MSDLRNVGSDWLVLRLEVPWEAQERAGRLCERNAAALAEKSDGASLVFRGPVRDQELEVAEVELEQD